MGSTGSSPARPRTLDYMAGGDPTIPAAWGACRSQPWSPKPFLVLTVPPLLPPWSSSSSVPRRRKNR
ncbi:hypothetical protein CapIbe_009801 [Capra ibex]